MLLQLEMIDRVRDLCAADTRVVAAWMYGSFPAGEADSYSDIEFVIYLRDEDARCLRVRCLVERVAPVALYFLNEFGVGAALFRTPCAASFTLSRSEPCPTSWPTARWRAFRRSAAC